MLVISNLGSSKLYKKKDDTFQDSPEALWTLPALPLPPAATALTGTLAPVTAGEGTPGGTSTKLPTKLAASPLLSAYAGM